MEVTLKAVEKEYSERIKNLLGTREVLTAEEMIALCKELFDDIAIKGISDSNNEADDMLSYQYGIYDWDDELGKHSALDITRLLVNSQNDSLYLLSFTLIYPPELFEIIESYSCWSVTFPDIPKFFDYIESTEGFKLAKQVLPKSYLLDITKC